MLNELLTEKFIVNIIQRHVATRFFIVQNCLAKKKKFYGNTVKSIDIVTPQKPKSNSRNNFVSQSCFSVLNCDEVSNNVLDDEINISNVLKAQHSNTTRLIQNLVQNPRRPLVVVNNSPENQHDFRRLKNSTRRKFVQRSSER